jgi:hypothetical protein
MMVHYRMSLTDSFNEVCLAKIQVAVFADTGGGSDADDDSRFGLD